MEPDDIPQSVDALLETLQAGRAQFEAAIDRLTAEQMAVAGEDGWSVKDHLAHLAAWERGIAALLRREDRWQAMGLDGDALGSEEEINETLRQQAAGLSLPEARASFAAAHDELVAAITALDDAELFRPYGYFLGDADGDDERPVLRWIIGNSYRHYEEHLPWIEALVASG